MMLTADSSELTEDILIKEQQDQSVQEFPDASSGVAVNGRFGFSRSSQISRKPLLRPRGDYLRLVDQYKWYHQEGNSMFRGVISGLTKRVQSLPYEIKAPPESQGKWDDFIRYANFSNWGAFVSQFVVAYSVYDLGAFVEIIAPGDPMKPPIAAATGMAILDPLRCFPTGDPNYPVIYTDYLGKRHFMHRSRIARFQDMNERNEDLPGWGDSALSRCVTPIHQEILISQYMQASLDDKPSPGFAVASGVTEAQISEQVSKMNEKRENDRDEFGRVIFLTSPAADAVVSLEFIQFQKEFTGFDPDKLSSRNARYMAAGVGVDVQDFWELSGQGIGTATQSQVMAEKSKGRALGRLIKGLERLINDILPDDVEFVIKYRNEEEDLERAQTAKTWTDAINGMSEFTTVDERRIMAANQIPALRDAATDQDGNVIRYHDADPQTPEQAAETITPLPSSQEEENLEENLIVGEEKALSPAATVLSKSFVRVIRELHKGDTTIGAVSVVLLSALRVAGEQAILDGMKRSGGETPQITPALKQELAMWLVSQRGRVRAYVYAIATTKMTANELLIRGQSWADANLAQMYYTGMSVGAPNKMWRWVTDLRQEKVCPNCLRMHGQRHKMSALIMAGVYPGASGLGCGEHPCGSELVEADGPARGKIVTIRRLF